MADWQAPPPTRGQQNLLGFMQMSSGQRFSLEQLMVESGRLEPEQTLNHRAWGPLSVLSASRKDVLAAQIGEFEDLTKKKIRARPFARSKSKVGALRYIAVELATQEKP